MHLNVPWRRKAKVFRTELPVGHGMFTMSLMPSVLTRRAYAGEAPLPQMDAKFFSGDILARRLDGAPEWSEEPDLLYFSSSCCPGERSGLPEALT